MRRRARVDRGQKRIADAFRALGCSVVDAHVLGGGFPDLVIGFWGRAHLVEVKSEMEQSDRGHVPGFTPEQLEFERVWLGCYHVAIADEDVRVLVSMWRQGKP